MPRESKKTRGVGLYVLWAGIFFLVLCLFMVLSVSRDIRREKERFARNTDYVHSYLDSVSNQNLIVLDGFAALMQTHKTDEIRQIAAYARFMLDNHDSIYSLGIVEKVSKVDLESVVAAQRRTVSPDFQAKAQTPLNGAHWGPVDDKSFYHLVTFIEPREAQTLPMLGMDLDSIPVLQDTLRRSLATEDVVASPPFRLFMGEMGYMLVRSLRRNGGEAYVMLQCKASNLLPPGLFNENELALSVYFQGENEGVKAWLIHAKAISSSPLASVFFPRFRTLRQIGGAQQPYVLEMEQQVNWAVVNWDMLAAIVASGILLFPLLLMFARIHHNREMERLEQGNKLFIMANFDALTGLPNRQLFINRLEQSMAVAKRQGLMHAVLFLDLDGFKGVNDYYGHQIGDKVLQRAARIFRRSVREVDTVARLGGDEFVILLQGVDGKSSAEQVAFKIKRAFRLPSIESSRSIPMIGTSIGIAIFPDDGETVDELLNAADLHMYQDKLAHKSQMEAALPARGQGGTDA